MGKVRLGASAAAIALITQAPCVSACPLCQAIAGESLKSYFAPTILLSLLPVAILGSIALWLRRAGRRTAADLQSTAKPESPGDSADRSR